MRKREKQREGGGREKGRKRELRNGWREIKTEEERERAERDGEREGKIHM